MRKHANWLTQTDERILEFLREYGNHPPSGIQHRLSEIGVDMEYHANHVGRRCRELEEFGLLHNVGGGTYAITDDGKEYLNGDLDAGTLD